MSKREQDVSRRNVLKVGAIATAVGATGVGLTGCASFGPNEHPIPTNAAGAAKWGREAGEWIYSCCNMCGGQCGIKVQVANGLINKIEPNNWNPKNYTNMSADFFAGYSKESGTLEGGAICPRGNAGIAQIYDPDRVKQPLKRTNADRSAGADPKWQPISWTQALDEISQKMAALRDAGEANKLLWMSEDNSFIDPQSDFCTLYGTPNYSMHSNICDVARKASFISVMGDDRPLTDFMNSKYILLFGWNPTSAIKWVYLPRILMRGIENGARLVVVDPYMSDTAAKGQEWVSIIPGTDGALALALGHVIVRDKLYDVDFITNWTSGFDSYTALVSDKTPEWAAEITGIPASRIESIAHELGTTRPALVDTWSGGGQQSNGVQGGRAIAMLNTLIGSWDAPGGMMITNRKGPKHIELEVSDVASKTKSLPRFDELDKYPLGHKSGVYAQMFSNLAEGKGPYKPKMMMIVFQNPVMSVPGRETVIKGLSSLETVVVIDTMMSETAMLADYVLPGTTYLERYDLTNNWVTWPVVSLRQPVVKPIFNQPAEYEVVAALARRLDLRDKAGVATFSVSAITGAPVENLTQWYEDYLSNELLQGGPAMSLADLKQLPGAVWVDAGGTKFHKYASPLAPEKLATAWYSGPKDVEGTLIYDKPKTDGGKQIGTVHKGQAVRGFFTATGLAQFFDPSLVTKKSFDGDPVNPIPDYVPRSWLPTAEYPLYLINWKEATHTHTRTQNNALLLEMKPTNPLMIHPDTAAKRGIQDGDEVIVKSPFGQVHAVVQVTLRMNPNVVGLQHGFGHTALGKLAKGRGTADGSLRPTKADPLSGMSMHKQTCVEVVRA